MSIASDYAKALYKVESPNADTLERLRHMLRRRGHEKLLPRIFAEYQKLQLEDERLKKYREVTPQMQRTKVLLELYKRLIATP